MAHLRVDVREVSCRSMQGHRSGFAGPATTPTSTRRRSVAAERSEAAVGGAGPVGDLHASRGPEPAPERGWAQAVKATCASIETVRSRRACGAIVGSGAGTDRRAAGWGRAVLAAASGGAAIAVRDCRAVKRPRRPPLPKPNRSLLRLSLAELEEVSRGLAAGESLRVIAGRLGRTREVARNGAGKL
jgi:hypothetical protein